jgi:carboxypeptidase PM20D1
MHTMKSNLTGFAAAFALLSPFATPARAEPRPYPAAEAQALELSRETIALRSVQGEGNRTDEVAQAFGKALVAGGWAESDIDIVPVDDTAYLIATWPGSDPTLGPVVI